MSATTSFRDEGVYAVVGATGGVGTALVRRLVTGGARVVALGRNEAGLNALAADLGVATQVCMAADIDALDTALGAVAAQHDGLAGVANCVGSLWLRPAHQTTAADFEATLRTNVHSAFAVVKAAGRLTKARGGSVVLVSSAAALVGLASHEAIAAAKGAVAALARSAAATYAGQGLRVNAVAPGLTRTPLTTAITANELSLKASVAMHALGRIGEPDEIAAAMAWLLSEESAWITGQVLGVDGGLACVRARSKA